MKTPDWSGMTAIFDMVQPFRRGNTQRACGGAVHGRKAAGGKREERECSQQEFHRFAFLARAFFDMGEYGRISALKGKRNGILRPVQMDVVLADLCQRQDFLDFEFCIFVRLFPVYDAVLRLLPREGKDCSTTRMFVHFVEDIRNIAAEIDEVEFFRAGIRVF